MLRFVFRAVVYSVPIFQDLMGLLYPVLATTKAAIQEDGDACSGWLVYWAIYSIVALFETCCEWVVSWLPLYPELKLAFVCWLVLPKFQGAALLYDRVLQQLFLEYEEQIDDQITSAQMEARKHVWSFLVYLVAEGTKLAGEKSTKALSLFLRLSGLGAGREDAGEDAVLAVASAVASVVEKNLDKATAVAEGQTRTSTVALKADAENSRRGDSKSGDSKSGDSSDSESGDGGDSKSGESGDSKSGDSSDSKSGDSSGLGSGDSGELGGVDLDVGDVDGGDEEAEEANPDAAKAEVAAEAEEEAKANAELLSDFLRVMADGVYLNVSTAEAPGQVRLRLVTLSDDTFRLLWTNVRDLRNANNTASSLHLCAVTAAFVPRDLCVSLATAQGLEAVAFEAQGREVHDVLRAGLALLVADAHARGRAQLAPLQASCRRRVLAETFRNLAAFGKK